MGPVPLQVPVLHREGRGVDLGKTKLNVDTVSLSPCLCFYKVSKFCPPCSCMMLWDPCVDHSECPQRGHGQRAVGRMISQENLPAWLPNIIVKEFAKFAKHPYKPHVSVKGS